MQNMRTRLSKLVRGAAGVAIAASGLGVIGAAGVALTTSGVAGAASHQVTNTVNCPTPAGAVTVPTTYKDTLTFPNTVHQGATVTTKWQVDFTVPASLIHLAHSATKTLKTITVASMTVNLKKVGLSGPAFISATNVPQKVLINTTTLHNGATLTFTYPTTQFTVTGTTTVSITPTYLSGHVIVPLTCGQPGQHVTVQTVTTVTVVTITGTNTSSPVDTGHVLAPLSLTPASGALPAGQVGHSYNYTNLTAHGGSGTITFSLSTAPAWLTLTQTGAKTAKLTGDPTAPGADSAKVTVSDTGGTTPVTNTYTITIAAAATTPQVLQPFKLTVTGGTLTMTCGKKTATPSITGVVPVKTTEATSPTFGKTIPVETQKTAKTCALITLGSIKLNERNQLINTKMNPLYISTARGGPSNSWVLNAVMVPTTAGEQAKAGVGPSTVNPTCGTVQGFCNLTTTNATRIRDHLINTSILPNYLYLHGFTCHAQTTPTSVYYNTNPKPTTAAGREITTVNHLGLAAVQTLCTARAGSSGGEFIVQTGQYTLIVPPNVYAGVYYGTVEYTLIAGTTHTTG